MKKKSNYVPGILIKLILVLMFLGTTSIYCASIKFLDGRTFSTTGLNSTKTIHIRNESTGYEAYEITSFARNLDIDGQDILSTSDDFIIEPRQILVEPKSEMFVTCSYIGPEDIDIEQAYRFKFKSVPLPKGNNRIKTKKGVAGGNVGMTMHYLKSAYVTSQEFQSNIEISNGVHEKDEEGNEWLKMVFVNTGSKHHVLRKTELIIYLKDKKIKLNPEELKLILILANSKIEKKIPWPEGVLPDNLNLGLNL
ncbi:hypothetical protein HOG98_07840 [bacterium]|jgi:P pilus assembly chaperone PapD|nr:hypothetical protein [bacterium]